MKSEAHDAAAACGPKLTCPQHKVIIDTYDRLTQRIFLYVIFHIKKNNSFISIYYYNKIFTVLAAVFIYSCDISDGSGSSLMFLLHSPTFTSQGEPFEGKHVNTNTQSCVTTVQVH